MKQIKINGREYLYEIISDFTRFYKRETIQRKKYLIFGPIINVEVSRFQFACDCIASDLSNADKEKLKESEQNYYNFINDIIQDI